MARVNEAVGIASNAAEHVSNLQSILDELQDINAQIEGHRQAFVGDIAQLDTLAQAEIGAANDAANVGPAITAALHDLEAKAEQTLSALQQQCVGALDNLEHEVRAQITAIENEGQQWTGKLSELDHTIEAFTEAASRTETELTDTLRQLKEHAEKAKEEAEAQLSALQQAVDDLTEEITGAATQALQEAARSFEDTISGPETEKLVTNFTDAVERVRSLAQDMNTNAEEVAQRLKDDMQRVLSSFADNVKDDLKQQFEDAGQKIVDTVVEELGMQITESVVASQVGVQLTSAMSPVLPYLIAINKALDIIRQAIRVYKDTIGRFTNLF